MDNSELIVTLCLIMIVSSLVLISAIITWMECKRLWTWWRNRGWRAGMQDRLDDVRKEHDIQTEFLMTIEDGMKGRGMLRGTLAGVKMADPDLCDFLVDFINDGLLEIEEEEHELERAIREL